MKKAKAYRQLHFANLRCDLASEIECPKYKCPDFRNGGNRHSVLWLFIAISIILGV
jgi:hypothetical protein